MNLAGSVLLCAALFASCSKSEETIDNGLAIRLNAGMKATVNSRAAVNNGDAFVAQVVGWETQDANNNYATAAKWNTTATITASEAITNVQFDKGQFYNGDKVTKTFMKAWSPNGTLATDGTVTFTSNGTVDVMLAPEVHGSAIDKGAKNLAFAHMLTQIKFLVVGDETFITNGTKVKSITVKEAQLPTGLNLTNNAVTYAAAAPLPIPDINAQLLTDREVAAGSCVMIMPFAGKTFKVDVVTNDGTTDTPHNDIVITIDKDENFVAGRAYTISLSFGAPGINGTASVTPWSTGTGSGTVE